MSLSPLVSFKSRFVSYLLNFPRIMRRVMFFFSSPNDIWVTKSRRMRRVGHIAHMGDKRGANLGDRDHLEDLGLNGRITS